MNVYGHDKKFQHQDLNAPRTQNAQSTLHASRKNVKTLASLPSVAWMPNARSTITEQSAFAELATLVIRTISVKNVRAFSLALKQNAYFCCNQAES